MSVYEVYYQPDLDEVAEGVIVTVMVTIEADTENAARFEAALALNKTEDAIRQISIDSNRMVARDLRVVKV